MICTASRPCSSLIITGPIRLGLSPGGAVRPVLREKKHQRELDLAVVNRFLEHVVGTEMPPLTVLESAIDLFAEVTAEDVRATFVAASTESPSC